MMVVLKWYYIFDILFIWGEHVLEKDDLQRREIRAPRKLCLTGKIFSCSVHILDYTDIAEVIDALLLSSFH